MYMVDLLNKEAKFYCYFSQSKRKKRLLERKSWRYYDLYATARAGGELFSYICTVLNLFVKLRLLNEGCQRTSSAHFP